MKEVAQLCGVSVRLLHHWDHVGLVSPSERLPNGYRLYSKQDIKRIQQSLLYRETGMSLEKIKELLGSSHSEEKHLRIQLELLAETSRQLQQKINAVRQLLEECVKGRTLSVEEKATLMGKEWLPEWEAEAQEKWGETSDWKETQANLANLTNNDWQSHRERMQKIEEKMSELCSAGISPDADQSVSVIEEYRKLCSKHHFEITYSKHVLLGKMYVNDPRFTDYYEQRGAGLAQWVCEAIEANARAHGIDPNRAEWE
ncbi:MerR family transcriptional regulator [Trueperella sp. LYQ143]|uniref:MerR family transcriptional regulator n=1 Tax=unclassified Trueperella TaxID=2630174 RepID=UPI003983A8F0